MDAAAADGALCAAAYPRGELLAEGAYAEVFLSVSGSPSRRNPADISEFVWCRVAYTSHSPFLPPSVPKLGASRCTRPQGAPWH